MVDAYGDGWNGGSFTMTDADGNVVFSSDGPANGISEEVNVCLGADCGVKSQHTQITLLK